MKKLRWLLGNIVILCLSSWSASAQQSDLSSWAATVQNDFRVIPDITYHQANGMELKIDVYQPRNQTGPAPTFIYYHGGGWVGDPRKLMCST